MRIEALGDLAVVLAELPGPAPALASAIELPQWTGVLDVVPCGETIGLYFDATFDRAHLESELSFGALTFSPRKHAIPICFERGPNLNDVASRLGLTMDRVIALYTQAEFSCFAIGFCAGFAYLGPIPEALRGVRRLPSPRTRTEPGSLGLTGNQTAVYPLPRPGGWPIVGCTPLVLVDENDDYFPIVVGDAIRFVQIDEAEFSRLSGARL